MKTRWSLLWLLLLIVTGCTTSTSYSTGGMSVEDFEFAASDGQTRNGATFKGGEQVLTRFKVTGIDRDDNSGVWVQEDLKVTDPAGKSLLDEQNLLDLKQKVEGDGAAFVTASNTITLPEGAAAGAYKIEMNLRDKNGGGTTTFKSTFQVEGEPASGETGAKESAPTEFDFAQVKFAEGQEGPERKDAVYAVGEQVWMLFDLVGFEQKEGGEVWIQEDLLVLDPDGDAILDQTNLLDFQDALDPGLEVIPAHNQVTLPEDPVPGQYTVRIVVRDKLSGQTIEREESFLVQ